MITMNRVELIGHLGHAPEVFRSPDGRTTVRFTVATDRPAAPGTSTPADWHRVVCWGTVAAYAEQHLAKGQLVYVAGRLTYRTWQGTDGRARHTTEVIAAELIVLSRPAGEPLAEQPVHQEAS